MHYTLTICRWSIVAITVVLLALACTATIQAANDQDHLAALILEDGDGATPLRVDSVPLPDTVKPRLRLGAVGRFHYTNASVAAIPIDPVATPDFGLGLRLEMEFLDPLYFFLELSWVGRNQRAWDLTSPSTPIEYEFNLSYLHFPLLFELQIPLSENLTATGAFGPAPSILLSRSQRISGPEFDTVLSIESGLNIFDFGLESRLGFEVGIDEKTSVAIGMTALFGQQNLLILSEGSDPRRWFTRSWGLTIGVNQLLQKAVRRDKSIAEE